jgi:hypothetical protein
MVNTARIDRTSQRLGERPAKTLHSYAVDKRAVFVRVVDNLPSAGDSWKNTARKKVLQIATFMAMRAVFWWVLRQGSSNLLARSSPDHRGAFKDAPNVVVVEEQAFGNKGAERDSGAFTSAGSP